MQERFLFRGKTLKSGAWLISGTIKLYNDDETTFIFPENIIYNDYFDSFECEIDPATFGQSTGLKDKNGKLIFEGDIVREYNGNYSKWDVGIIEWHTGYWTIEFAESNCGLFGCLFDHLEIIGNIHDNPELIPVCGEESVV
jgi:uncharacterized phage protein (TIGR01671 family)